MASSQLPTKNGLAYGDYLLWEGDGRWELIDGVVYDMSPAPSIDHQRISGDIFNQIYTFLDGRPCEVFAAPFDVRLPKSADEADEDIKDVVQPDIVVVCDPEKLDRRGCRGAPDWIVEIVSPSTAAKDNIEKLALYERNGVKEYWIVHPAYRIATVYTLGPDRLYGRPKSYPETEKIEPVALPGLSVNLKTVFKGVSLESR